VLVFIKVRALAGDLFHLFRIDVSDILCIVSDIYHMDMQQREETDIQPTHTTGPYLGIQQSGTTPPAPARARTDDGDRVVVTIQSAIDEFSIVLPADANIISLKSAISASKGYRVGYQQLFVKDSEEPLADFVKFSDLFGSEEERKVFLVLEKSEGDANMCVQLCCELFFCARRYAMPCCLQYLLSWLFGRLAIDVWEVGGVV
jgi:hypothetical protein